MARTDRPSTGAPRRILVVDDHPMLRHGMKELLEPLPDLEFCGEADDAAAAVEQFTRLDLPVIAIGGVTPQRVREVRAAGVYGVAAIRALWDARDPAAAAQEMSAGMEER